MQASRAGLRSTASARRSRRSPRRPFKTAMSRAGSGSVGRVSGCTARPSGSRLATRAFPACASAACTYEVTLPGKQPIYHEVSATIQPGERHHVAVLEVAGHTDWWSVWVDGHTASKPYHLPGSHGAWRGIATAESWGGGVRACNLDSYRFNRVAIAHKPGGNWQLVSSVDTMHQGDNRFVPRTTSSFVARTKTLPPAAPRPTATRGTTASRTATANHASTPTPTSSAPTHVRHHRRRRTCCRRDAARRSDRPRRSRRPGRSGHRRARRYPVALALRVGSSSSSRRSKSACRAARTCATGRPSN